MAMVVTTGDVCQNNSRRRIAIQENDNLWAKLPRELLLKLLEGLTLKELARLRLVCKFFHSLLSSDLDFATFYDPPQTKFFLHSLGVDQLISKFFLRSLRVDPSIFFVHDEIRRRSRWMPPPCCPPLLYLVVSNGGMLCFVGNREPNIPTIFVYSPTAPNLWNILTVPEGELVVSRNSLIGIAFDRKLGACKIVLTGPKYSQQMTRTLIFDAKAETWRRLPDLYDVLTPIRMTEPFVFNGYLYWLVLSSRPQCEMVVSFNVEKEQWEPPLVLDDQSFSPLCIADLEKEPCVISLNKQNSQKLDLWKLDIQGRQNHTWARTITAPFILESSTDVFGGGEEICLANNRSLWVYHLGDKVWRCVGLFHGDVCNGRNFADYNCTFYKPSLLRFQGDQLLKEVHKIEVPYVDSTLAWLDL